MRHAILEAYEAALADRDPRTVDIFDLLPVIYAAVPNASDGDIVAALRWGAEAKSREADALERFADQWEALMIKLINPLLVEHPDWRYRDAISHLRATG